MTAYRLVGAGSGDLEAARPLWRLFAFDIVRELGGPPSAVASGVSETRLAGGNVDVEVMRWAKNLGIPYAPFPYPTVAELTAHGIDVSKLHRPAKAAGPIRNGWMAQWAAEAPVPLVGVVAVLWNGYSPGSASMLHEARKRDLLIFERVVEQ